MTAGAPRLSPAGSLLVVRLGAMGDVIHTLLAVSALGGCFPELRIGWAIESRWAELVCAKDASPSGPRSRLRPLVNVVHLVDTKLWRKSPFSPQIWRDASHVIGEIRRQRYDVVADFQGALKSAILARSANGGKIAGMARPRERPAAWLYSEIVQVRGAHVVDQYHSLAEALAQRSLPRSEALFPCVERAEQYAQEQVARLGGDFALITPGSGWGGKQWPGERFGRVAHALARLGIPSLVNSSPQELELARTVEAASRGSARMISCSIGELISLTRRARLVIAGDTGPLHLAAALHIPVIALFGSTDPARTGPWETRSIVLRHPQSRTSTSHRNTPDPGLLLIQPEEVVSAAEELLEAPSA